MAFDARAVLEFNHKLVDALRLAGQQSKKIVFTADHGQIATVTVHCLLTQPLDFIGRDVVKIDVEGEARSIPLVAITFCPTQEEQDAALALLREYGIPLRQVNKVDADDQLLSIEVQIANERLAAAKTEHLMTWMKHVQWGKHA